MCVLFPNKITAFECRVFQLFVSLKGLSIGKKSFINQYKLNSNWTLAQKPLFRNWKKR